MQGDQALWHRIEKGGAAMEGDKEFTIGGTKIKVCDDFCCYENQKEMDKQIMERIVERALQAIRSNPSRYYEVKKELELKKKKE